MNNTIKATVVSDIVTQDKSSNNELKRILKANQKVEILNLEIDRKYNGGIKATIKTKNNKEHVIAFRFLSIDPYDY